MYPSFQRLITPRFSTYPTMKKASHDAHHKKYTKEEYQKVEFRKNSLLGMDTVKAFLSSFVWLFEVQISPFSSSSAKTNIMFYHRESCYLREKKGKQLVGLSVKNEGTFHTTSVLVKSTMKCVLCGFSSCFSFDSFGHNMNGERMNESMRPISFAGGHTKIIFHQKEFHSITK